MAPVEDTHAYMRVCEIKDNLSGCDPCTSSYRKCLPQQKTCVIATAVRRVCTTFRWTHL